VTFGVTINGDTTPECDEASSSRTRPSATGDETMKEAKLLIADDDGRPDAGACPDPFATRSEPIEPAPEDAGTGGAPDAPTEPPASRRPTAAGAGSRAARARHPCCWPAALALAVIAFRGRPPPQLTVRPYLGSDILKRSHMPAWRCSPAPRGRRRS
jgi:hypothetical protein